MTLPVGIANKLLQLLEGTPLPASALQHTLVTKMLEDGVVQKQQTGKTKALLFVNNPTALHAYLRNHFGVNDLQAYAGNYNNEVLTRADAVTVSSHSKLRAVRTFKGFLVNTYSPVETTLHGQPFTISPVDGSYTFISDYEAFQLPPQVTIIGVENPENFRYLVQQQYLFDHLQPLFVSRYPQSNDLLQWLKSIPNKYLHFGDFDFAGINIYLHEYKRHLGEKASFFIPPKIEILLDKYGNRDLYNKQLPLWKNEVDEPDITALVALLHQFKKGLEQEVFINFERRQF